MEGAGRGDGIVIRLSDKDRYQAMKAILAYESTVRGRNLGQVFAELVMEVIDLESYPPELRKRIADLEHEASLRSAGKAMGPSGDAAGGGQGDGNDSAGYPDPGESGLLGEAGGAVTMSA